MSLEHRLGAVERVFDHWDGKDQLFGPRRYDAMHRHIAEHPLPPMSEADYARFEEIIRDVLPRMQARYPAYPEEELMYQFTYFESVRDYMTPQEIAEAEALLGIVHDDEKAGEPAPFRGFSGKLKAAIEELEPVATVRVPGFGSTH